MTTREKWVIAGRLHYSASVPVLDGDLKLRLSQRLASLLGKDLFDPSSVDDEYLKTLPGNLRQAYNEVSRWVAFSRQISDQPKTCEEAQRAAGQVSAECRECETALAKLCTTDTTNVIVQKFIERRQALDEQLSRMRPTSAIEVW